MRFHVAPVCLVLLSCSSMVDTGGYRDERAGAHPEDAGHDEDASLELDGGRGRPERPMDGGEPDATLDGAALDGGRADASPSNEPEAGAPAQIDAGNEDDAGGRQRPPPPLPTQFVTLARGDMSAVVVGADRLPMVFVHGMGPDPADLGLVRCLDEACNRSDQRTLEEPGDGGLHPRAILDRAGRPLLAYHQAWWGEAKLLRCRDARCEQSDRWFMEAGIDQDNFGLGLWTSIALSADGFPLLAYYDPSVGDLRATLCAREDCCDVGSSCAASVAPRPRSFVVASAGGNVGSHGSVALSPEGWPRFAFRSESESALLFAACSDPTCTGAIHSRQLDNSGDVGQFAQLLIGADGLPRVFHYDETRGDLRLTSCLDPLCESVSARVLDGDRGGDVGEQVMATLDPSGHPFAVYHDRSQGDLKALSCRDSACTDFDVVTVDGAQGHVGGWPSVAFRPGDGLPVISYQDVDNDRIKLALCTTTACAP